MISDEIENVLDAQPVYTQATDKRSYLNVDTFTPGQKFIFHISME